MEDKRRSRRKFLADALFAGGGLTAAAFLAKAGLAGREPEPHVAGDVMVAPPPGNAPNECPPSNAECQGKPECQDKPECPVAEETPCEKALPIDQDPNIAGGVRVPVQLDNEPQLRGRVKMPESRN